MVRVMPVHNFLCQSVEAIEEPTASCTATNHTGKEMLLLALSSHCVEVHELGSVDANNDDDNKSGAPRVSTVFPTVDLVRQIVHCKMENYVATLESKTSRDGTNVNYFVRIYVNWALKGNQNQAMRARIAGRVTPSSNRLSDGLEMIELPLSGQPPTRISTCQVTGNLLVATGDSAILHELKVERQQLSKQKFIDFEARPWSLGFSFSPTHIEIVEDFFLIMDRHHIMLFRLMNQLYEDIDLLNSSNSTSERSASVKKSNKAKKKTGQHTEFLDWNQLVSISPQDEERLISRGIINEKSRKFSIELPALESQTTSNSPPNHINNSSISSSTQLNVVIKTSSPTDGWSENYIVEKLLQLTININNNSDNTSSSKVCENSEYFTTSLLKPVYLKQKQEVFTTSGAPVNRKRYTLRSEKYKNLDGVSCVICTIQEGYVLYFKKKNLLEINKKTSSYWSYPFTAPVSHVVLEDTVLHALTDAGLETYTLRLSENILSDTCEETNDLEPVSLIGLRPFMGVRNLLHINRYIVLLTQAEQEQHWTLYSLELPPPINLLNDIINAAINHKTLSPTTYKHLIAEAHMIISLVKDLENFESFETNDAKEDHQKQLEELYRKSCGLLADYYIRSQSPREWSLSLGYYKKSGLKASQILSEKSIDTAPGLGTYLTDTLLNLKSGADADALFQVHNIVEMIAGRMSKQDVVRLIFGSVVLREYATDKLITIVSSFITEMADEKQYREDDATRYALVLLYVQADRQEQAEKILKSISSDKCILSMSLAHWDCLFDVTRDERQSGTQTFATFSELSVILMRFKSLLFADILAKVIEKKALSLHQILQIFLAHLPSRVGRDGHVAASVLQLFVETYLCNYFADWQPTSRQKQSSATSSASTSSSSSSSDPKNDNSHQHHNDYSIVEAFKILVRSYLGKLTQANVYTIKEDNKDYNIETRLSSCENNEYLFGKSRPLFLDKMHCQLNTTGSARSNINKKEMMMRAERLKLQALLASGYLPNECLQEVEEFLKAHTIDGDDTFRILCLDNNQATLVLLEKYPQALLQFAKVYYYTSYYYCRRIVEFVFMILCETRLSFDIIVGEIQSRH